MKRILKVLEEPVTAPEGAVVIGALLILLCALCSCSKTVYVPTETVRTEVRIDTVRQTQMLRDSVYHRDSIYIEGETVVKERWRYKYVTKTDTVYKVKVDTVEYFREATKMVEVERKEGWWSKFLKWCGAVALFGVIGWVAVSVGRWKKDKG